MTSYIYPQNYPNVGICIYMCTCDHIIHFMNQHNKLNVAWGQEMGLGSQGQDDEESER